MDETIINLINQELDKRKISGFFTDIVYAWEYDNIEPTLELMAGAAMDLSEFYLEELRSLPQLSTIPENEFKTILTWQIAKKIKLFLAQHNASKDGVYFLNEEEIGKSEDGKDELFETIKRLQDDTLEKKLENKAKN